MATDVDVVIFDENKFVAKLRVAHHLRNLLKHALARFVERVRFAGENKLNRPLRIVDHRSQTLDVRKNQICALVCSEAARETDRQCIRAEYAAQADALFLRFAAALGLFHRAAPNKFEQSRLQIEVRLPKLAVVNVLDTFPNFRFGSMLLPAGTEMTVVEA